ncbi:MAG: hypothetical protein U9R48_00505 [Chloroflexota bacterium]|nr:hypothetical protein [Chloroflexota bacterium]
METHICAATGIVLFLIGLVGFLWPRHKARRPAATVLMVNGVTLYLTGALQTGGTDGRAAALLVLGLLPVEYLMAASLRCEEG